MKENDFVILIVDDEEKIRENLQSYFELSDFKVLVASGGREALEIVKSEQVNFIISDVRMPDGDGEELIGEVRKLNPDLPVIVMITGFSEMTREKAIEKGAMELLAKPVDITELEKLIESEFNRVRSEKI